MHFPLSVETGQGWPLLLVPGADGIHVSAHRDQVDQAQLIGNSIDGSQHPSPANPGFATTIGLDLSVGDINADGREDLVVRRSLSSRTSTYRLYLQQTNDCSHWTRR